MTRWTPPDHWQTDNFNGLVMVVGWTRQAESLILTCSAPLVQTGERKQLSLFDLDLWPTTLTYNPRLTKVKVDPHAKKSRSKVKRFKQDSAHRQTDTHAHGRYQTYYRHCYAVDNYSQNKSGCCIDALYRPVSILTGVQRVAHDCCSGVDSLGCCSWLPPFLATPPSIFARASLRHTAASIHHHHTANYTNSNACTNWT